MAGKPKSFTDLTDSRTSSPHWLPSQPLAKAKHLKNCIAGNKESNRGKVIQKNGPGRHPSRPDEADTMTIHPGPVTAACPPTATTAWPWLPRCLALRVPPCGGRSRAKSYPAFFDDLEFGVQIQVVALIRGGGLERDTCRGGGTHPPSRAPRSANKVPTSKGKGNAHIQGHPTDATKPQPPKPLSPRSHT